MISSVEEYDKIQGEIDSKLIDLCVDIYAHSELDWEWTNLSHGNSTNSFEASNVADDIFKIIEVDKQAVLDTLVRDRIRELKEHLS